MIEKWLFLALLLPTHFAAENAGMDEIFKYKKSENALLFIQMVVF